MYRWLTTRVSFGVLVLALCILTPAGLRAAPISMDSPGAEPLSAGFSSSLTPDSLCSLCDIPYTANPANAAMEFANSSPIGLAAVTAAEPGPSASILIVIGAAMIWLAGVIRYSPRSRD